MTDDIISRPVKKWLKDWRMCAKCAEAKGGVLEPDGPAITVSMGTCKYCETVNVVLIPYVDFNWPKDAALDRHAKLSRD